MSDDVASRQGLVDRMGRAGVDDPMIIAISFVLVIMLGVLGAVFLHGWLGIPLWAGTAIGALAGLFPVVHAVIRHD